MALQPIDLQTLFVRLSQVGREQSAIKQAVAQNQLVTGNEIAQRSRETESTVGESPEISDGPETVNEDQNPRQQQAFPESRGESGETAEESDEDVFHDPDLGRHIDVTG